LRPVDRQFLPATSFTIASSSKCCASPRGFGKDEWGRAVAICARVSGRTIAEIETLVVREGDAFVFGADNPKHVSEHFTSPLQRDRRRSRERLLAIANSYFDGIERADGSAVPACSECHRSENGVRTTGVTGLNGCTGAMKFITTIRSVRDRRFPVVDETRGLVLALTAFDIPTGISHLPEGGVLVARKRSPRSIFFFHVFKIDDGEICEITAMLRNAPLGASPGWPGERHR
jgi:hypothetical protein